MEVKDNEMILQWNTETRHREPILWEALSMELIYKFTEVYLNNEPHQWEEITGTGGFALIIVKSWLFIAHKKLSVCYISFLSL